MQLKAKLMASCSHEEDAKSTRTGISKENHAFLSSEECASTWPELRETNPQQIGVVFFAYCILMHRVERERERERCLFIPYTSLLTKCYEAPQIL